MTIKEFFSFRQNKYFWLNLAAMVLVVAGVMYGVLVWMDVYTRHGEAVVVPDVKGMSASEAGKVLRNHGLDYAVSDSTYVKNLPAGSVLDYSPAAGQKVKEGRIVYLTVNTLNVPLRAVPDVADNSSVRQAEARLLASGFKVAGVDTISGERDWVYGLKFNGRELKQGEQIPVGSFVRLVVGDGRPTPEAEAVPEDDTDTETTTGGTDDSWF
ncbi:PASTA domain-containing protein [uncultured Bacteroides sp.]|uniref:PASTA domain-containing protein n=1 Tax=uncultured Bacteroides sp. TaxID=162156 RepID=UPI002602939D|nr:PASTA domain-containing protein [uncultured Bacteroides sp.]